VYPCDISLLNFVADTIQQTEGRATGHMLRALPYSVTSTVDATFLGVADMSCLSVSRVRHVDFRNRELKRSPVAKPVV
jgi:hypothetical protein